jgi:hypothetical protein
MTTIQATRPYARAPRSGDSWWYAGCLISSLAEATETAGQLSAVEAVIRKGMEPPPHTHTHEDEAFYIIAGTGPFRSAAKPLTPLLRRLSGHPALWSIPGSWTPTARGR